MLLLSSEIVYAGQVEAGSSHTQSYLKKDTILRRSFQHGHSPRSAHETGMRDRKSHNPCVFAETKPPKHGSGVFIIKRQEQAMSRLSRHGKPKSAREGDPQKAKQQDASGGQDLVADLLRQYYAAISEEEIPPAFTQLLQRLQEAEKEKQGY